MADASAASMPGRSANSAVRAKGVAPFVPTRVTELELSAPIPPIDVRDGDRSHSRALVLVRLHGEPLGLLELELGDAGLSRGEVASEVWRAVTDSARAHLERDGLPVPLDLNNEGLNSPPLPKCIAERNDVLNTAPSTSVIVATHERPKKLQRCLDSLLELHYPTYEIIVVDSAPISSSTHDVVLRYGDRIRYLRVDRPGLAVAHNAALPCATGEILAFIDDDVAADRLWLASLAAAFASDRDVACATGLILPLELETAPQWWVVAHSRLNKGFERRLYDLDANRPAQPLFPYTAGTFGSGTNMAFSAWFLREIDGFDPALGVGTATKGGDDLAVFFDVVDRGHVLAYEPAAIVWHDYRSDYASLARHFFSYGVGLSAFLTRTIARRPRRGLTLLRLFPLGVFHMLRIRSRDTLEGVPRRFVYREWAGMLLGPATYVVSRLRNSR